MTGNPKYRENFPWHAPAEPRRTSVQKFRIGRSDPTGRLNVFQASRPSDLRLSFRNGSFSRLSKDWKGQ